MNEYGVQIRPIGPHVGQASGLKMCSASLTKGLTALSTAALTAGRALGLDELLTRELQESQQVLFQWFERQIPQMPPKAYRWVGEMEEIARTFGDLRLPAEMMEGAAALYRLMGRPSWGLRRRKSGIEDRHVRR